jgi:hypothetical protein
LILEIVLIALGTIAVLFFAAIQVIDMASRVEYLQNHFPRLLKWAEHKEWHGVVLVITALLLAGNVYEIVTDEPLVVKMAVPAIDPGAKDATIIQQQQVIADLKKRPESCPKCEAGSTTRLDILCQNLADCPSAELAKRARELIEKLLAITEPYNADFKGWENAIRNEQPGSPAYNDLQARMTQSMRGEAARVMGSYRVHHIEVVAMREALIRRVGHSDQSEDSEYQIVGRGDGNPHMVDEIIYDLTTLTGEVRNLRQH